MPLWEAFWDLDTCRAYGFGVIGRIPWTAINDYAQRHSVESPEFDYLVGVIQSIDESYTQAINKRDT